MIIVILVWTANATHISHFALPPRAQIHAGNAMDNSHCTVYLLRHLRKFLLLSALPSNADAIRAIETLSAPIQSEYDRSQPQNSKPSQLRQLQQEPWDLDAILNRHDAEHDNIGLDVLLGTEEVERLNLILQAPRGGLIDDPPLWISELLPSADATRWPLLGRGRWEAASGLPPRTDTAR